MVSNQNFEVLYRRELIGLEDVRFRRRIRDQIFNGEFANLRIWAGNEAHELLNISMRSLVDLVRVRLTSSNSLGISTTVL